MQCALSTLLPSLADSSAPSESIRVASQYDPHINATHSTGYSAGNGKRYHKALQGGRLDARQESHQAGQQNAYRLSIADVIRDDERRRARPAVKPGKKAPIKACIAYMTTPIAEAEEEDNWPSDRSDAGRSDRSSSLEDVIPPSIWRVARPAASHPTKASIPATTRSALQPRAIPRHRGSMSYVGRSTDVIPPSFWGVAKHRSVRLAQPFVPASTTSPKTRHRARISPALARDVRSSVSARHDPAWKAAMTATGKKISVTMGLYLAGEITVNGEYAATVLRETPCERCRVSGRECRVADKSREKNLVSDICSYCIRQRRKCAT
ncbi:hypothetical protein Q9L58_006244 [Maublancomyces gigas]|uniref:Zn(2)-C6 fungal-type domain-containing protein n=1 Tax=Discina gigas TaxID=1032678 RepID=A0ABR3GGZ1_9PEZI